MDQRWDVKSYPGPQGERMWAVVHRAPPMFLAVISERSLESLEEMPRGAMYWSKPVGPEDAAEFRRSALRVLKERRLVGPAGRTRGRARAVSQEAS
jgi:hypothetical protein